MVPREIRGRGLSSHMKHRRPAFPHRTRPEKRGHMATLHDILRSIVAHLHTADERAKRDLLAAITAHEAQTAAAPAVVAQPVPPPAPAVPAPVVPAVPAPIPVVTPAPPVVTATAGVPFNAGVPSA